MHFRGYATPAFPGRQDCTNQEEQAVARKNRKLRIGMLKAMPGKWDVEGNWAIFEQEFKGHRGDDLDVFITPECFLDGYAVSEKNWTLRKFTQVAQEMDTSPYIRRLRQLARRARTQVVFGFTEMIDGYFYNCAVLVGTDGSIIGKYHKTHLQSFDRHFAPGRDLPVFDLGKTCAGIAICADRKWPETIRTLRLQGAEICLMPTYGIWGLENEWWMRTRSFENQMFICFTHPAEALITNPRGEVAAKLQSNLADVLVHEVDLEEVGDTNQLHDRRPELYQVLADTEHPSRQKPYQPAKAK